MRRGEVPPLKRYPLHSSEDFVGAEPWLDPERLDRRAQKA
jgi:hypothetical protein